MDHFKQQCKLFISVNIIHVVVCFFKHKVNRVRFFFKHKGENNSRYIIFILCNFQEMSLFLHQIWRNVALHHCLCSEWVAVRMRVQTADKNITIISITYIDAKTYQNEENITTARYCTYLSSKQFISCQMSYFTKLRITSLYYVIADCCYQH